MTDTQPNKHNICYKCDKRYKDLSKHYYRNPEHKPEFWDSCPSCNERYEDLGNHWSSSSCSYPELTEFQTKVLTGILMGDGSRWKTDEGHTGLQINMITKPYLLYIDEVLEYYSTTNGVTISETAKESAEGALESGFSKSATEKNYNDVYYLRTRKSPVFDTFDNWYNGDGYKVFPENINLNPITLKHWYVNDGHLSKDGNRISIEMSSQYKQKDVIDDIFKEKVGISLKWDEYTENDGTRHCRLKILNSEKFLNYIGNPVPGFEYKWLENPKEPPKSAADQRPNGEPYYIDSSCDNCNTELSLYDANVISKKDNDVWWDEWQCKLCENGIHMDWPEEYEEEIFGSREPVDEDETSLEEALDLDE